MNCDIIKTSDFFLKSQYTFTVNCGDDYKFKQVNLLAISLDLNEEIKNDQKCKKNIFSLDLSTSTSCKDGGEIETPSQTACLGKNSACTFNYNVINMTTKCASELLSVKQTKLYFSYTCESKLFN
jgi:hypothetical protein